MVAFALSNYDLKQLKTFLAVVEHGGVSAATYRLGASLSTVSRDLSSLERRLGFQLCRRGRSGFSLTPQGADLHQAAVRLFSEVQSFESNIQSMRQTLGGGFNLGVIDNVVTNNEAGVVAALSEMYRRFPDMLINVSVHSVALIDVQVRDRRIDIGITGQPEWLSGLEYEPAFSERHHLYISRRSPHLDQVRESLADRGGQHTRPIPYIARDYRSDAFGDFEGGYPLQVVARGGTLESVLAAVLAGVGCAILPRHYVEATRAADLLELETPYTPLNVQFYFAYRKDAANMRSIRALINCCGETLPR